MNDDIFKKMNKINNIHDPSWMSRQEDTLLEHMRSNPMRSPRRSKIPLALAVAAVIIISAVLLFAQKHPAQQPTPIPTATATAMPTATISSTPSPEVTASSTPLPTQTPGVLNTLY